MSTIVYFELLKSVALQPFETWSFYCMGKSARDMLFKVRYTNFYSLSFDVIDGVQGKDIHSFLVRYDVTHAIQGKVIKSNQSFTKPVVTSCVLFKVTVNV